MSPHSIGGFVVLLCFNDMKSCPQKPISTVRIYVQTDRTLQLYCHVLFTENKGNFKSENVLSVGSRDAVQFNTVTFYCHTQDLPFEKQWDLPFEKQWISC